MLPLARASVALMRPVVSSAIERDPDLTVSLLMLVWVSAVYSMAWIYQLEPTSPKPVPVVNRGSAPALVIVQVGARTLEWTTQVHLFKVFIPLVSPVGMVTDQVGAYAVNAKATAGEAIVAPAFLS